MDWDWVSATGSLLSFLGVLVALHQIGKVKNAAESARKASENTSLNLQRNMAMIDISSCINEIDEIKTLVRGNRFESALLRVSDLIGKMIQIKAMPKSETVSEIKGIKNILAQLDVLRDLLEKKLHKQNTAFNQSQVNKVLSSIADELHAWIGENKFSLAENTNDK